MALVHSVLMAAIGGMRAVTPLAAVAKTMVDLGDQYNAPALMEALVHGLESAEGDAPKNRVAYARVLRTAADAVRRLKRD